MGRGVFLLWLLSVGLLRFSFLSAQGPGDEFSAEHDPSKRAELAIAAAESSFDDARTAYLRGNTQKGDSQLEIMTGELNVCIESLGAARKARFYKKAELRVAYLQRRLAALLDDIELPRRGWAEQTSRKLDEIHDKLLEGVMRK